MFATQLSNNKFIYPPGQCAKKQHTLIISTPERGESKCYVFAIQNLLVNWKNLDQDKDLIIRLL